MPTNKPPPLTAAPPPSLTKPDIPSHGVSKLVRLPLVLAMIKNLELEDMYIPTSGPDSIIHPAELEALFNICLKQQERIDVLEQVVDSIQGMLLP